MRLPLSEVTAPKIEFGTDGIRGIAGHYPLDALTVLTIGRAIGRWLFSRTPSRPRVILGRDTRQSGHFLLHTLASGFLSEGIDVADAGVITTPGIAFLTKANHFHLGIVISASHNPADQNGIKVFGADGFKLSDADEAAIEALIAMLDPRDPVAQMGRSETRSGEIAFASAYIARLTESFTFETFETLGIVLDAANGAASTIGVEAFRRAGALQLIRLNTDPDGVNINVEAGSEFVRRNRNILHQAILDNKAHLGIAFDGDADRVVMVTPGGNLVDGDHLLGILALWLKDQGKLKGNTVVATDMSNSGLEYFLNSHGITLIRTKVGDRYVMDSLREGGFTLGGEQAGHVILLDNGYTAGDGIYVALLVSAIVAENRQHGGATLDDLIARIPRYPQVIASATLNQRVDLTGLAGLDTLKGETLNAFEGKGRVNVRFSGTEPNLLRVMIEGGPHTSMSDVITHAMAFCKLVGAAAETPHPIVDLVDCATGAPIAF
jgi:phosphoglucosamine mutase